MIVVPTSPLSVKFASWANVMCCCFTALELDIAPPLVQLDELVRNEECTRASQRHCVVVWNLSVARGSTLRINNTGVLFA